MKSQHPDGSPQKFGEELYWKFNEFENLTMEEVKKCCFITLKILMINEKNTSMRLFYDLARNFIKERGQ